MKWKVHIKHFHYIPKHNGCLEEKHLCGWVTGWTSHSCPGIPFLLERTTDRYLIDIFSKMNNIRQSFQGKQLMVFVANDKMQTFKQIQNSGKLVSAAINLTVS